MRALIATASLAAVATLLPAQPASAAGVAFTGTMHITCYGCGTGTMTATVTVSGIAHGQVVTGNATMTGTVSMHTGGLCDANWTATGSVSGAVDFSFDMTVVAHSGLMTESGAERSTIGWLQYAIGSPVGIPCGGPVDATIWGEF